MVIFMTLISLNQMKTIEIEFKRFLLICIQAIDDCRSCTLKQKKLKNVDPLKANLFKT